MLYKSAFPNKMTKIDDIVATEDNRIVVSWTCTGTQKGEFQGHPATGKSFKIPGISIYTFKNEKICDVHQIWDKWSLLNQIGALELQHPHTAAHR